jgi:hypothetical protein
MFHVVTVCCCAGQSRLRATSPRRGSRVPAFTPLTLPSAAGVTRLRLGRLRAYISVRMQPSFRGLPLLEHATAVLDARVLLRAFGGWIAWARGHRRAVSERRLALLQKYWDKLEIRSDKMKAVKQLAVVNTRRTAKVMLARWVRAHRSRKRCAAVSLEASARFSTMYASLFVRVYSLGLEHCSLCLRVLEQSLVVVWCGVVRCDVV